MNTQLRFAGYLGITLIACCGSTAAAKDAANVGYLVTDIRPTRTGVFVDGKYLGPAANFGFVQKYELAPGEHKLTLTDPRYEEYTTSIQIEAGKRVRIQRSLTPIPEPQPPFAILKIKSDSKFDGVWINGKFMGHADEFDNRYQKLLVPPGEYVVRIASPDGQTKREDKVTLTAGQITQVGASQK